MPYAGHYSFPERMRKEQNANVKMLKLLLNYGVDPNKRIGESIEHIPIVWAANKRYKESVKALLDAGALVDDNIYKYLGYNSDISICIY